MDKVIIDGVDVSECEYFQEDGGENTCRAEEDYTGTVVCCSACDNCYYKQLKRLEQENEKLKQVANDSIIEQEKLIAKVNELQSENERLKEENYGLNQELLGYKKGVQASEIIELKQTLQEIRDKLDFNKQELEECLYNPIDDEIREIINSVIGAEE